MKVSVAETFGQPTLRSFPDGSACGTNQVNNFTSASPRRQYRLYTDNGIKPLIRHLHKASHYIITPRPFARNPSYKRSWFWRTTSQAHPQQS